MWCMWRHPEQEEFDAQLWGPKSVSCCRLPPGQPELQHLHCSIEARCACDVRLYRAKPILARDMIAPDWWQAVCHRWSAASRDTLAPDWLQIACHCWSNSILLLLLLPTHFHFLYRFWSPRHIFPINSTISAFWELKLQSISHCKISVRLNIWKWVFLTCFNTFHLKHSSRLWTVFFKKLKN